jgi:preprotein translocase, yajC subunit
MNTFLLSAAMQQQGGGMGIFIMMGAVLIIFWLFMIRPQQKKQNKIKAFQNALQEGTRVVTAGGMYGTIKHVNLENNTIDLEIARGTIVTVNKNYVFEDASAPIPNA